MARIAVVNPALNAIILDRYDAARAEAKVADQTFATAAADAKLSPLLGIPCTVKEFFAVAGMPQTGGMVAYRDRRPTADSEVVRRLRDAGAVIVGLTNVPEGGMWMETWNKLYGRTSNPWDVTRTSGGSSGGEGAIVGAGGAVFGIGSDIGGSVRIPAAFCGTVGHKPSGGMIPLTGHFPPGIAGTQYLCAGPLCRRVGDVYPILQTLVGRDGVDPECTATPAALRDPGTVDLARVRVFPVSDPPGVHTRAVMQSAVADAAACLRGYGATVQAANLPSLGEQGLSDLRWAMLLWAASLTGTSQFTYDQLLSGGDGIALGRELWGLLRGRSQYITPSLVIVMSERVSRFLGGGGAADGQGSRMAQLRGRLDRLRTQLDDLLGDDGVLIYPPYTRPAPHHYRPLLTPFDPACTLIFNVLGYPSTVVPLGLSRDGLPVSVQVVARHGMDHLTLAVAAAIETKFGGWVPPAQISAGHRG